MKKSALQADGLPAGERVFDDRYLSIALGFALIAVGNLNPPAPEI